MVGYILAIGIVLVGIYMIGGGKPETIMNAAGRGIGQMIGHFLRFCMGLVGLVLRWAGRLIARLLEEFLRWLGRQISDGAVWIWQRLRERHFFWPEIRPALVRFGQALASGIAGMAREVGRDIAAMWREVGRLL